MRTIRYAEISDKKFWYSLDKHLPETNLRIRCGQKEGMSCF